MKKRILALLLMVSVLIGSMVFTSYAADANETLLLAKSLLAIGYPSSEYTSLKNAYSTALSNQSSGNITALQNAAKSFMSSLYTPGSSFPMTQKFTENFSNADAVNAELDFIGKNIVDGKYQTAWTGSLEMFFKNGFENVKYEFKMSANSPFHAGFALRVEPGKGTNMFGGGRSNVAESEAAYGVTFDIVNKRFENQIAVGFHDGAMNTSPIVGIPYPAGFVPGNENSFVVYDYGNVITMRVNGANFCQLVFEANAAATYAKCYVYKADGTLVGTATDCGTYKKGGFTVASRTGSVSIDDLKVSTFGGMYQILDTQPLKDALATAKAKTNIGYVTSTWRRLQSAIQEAEKILAKNENAMTVSEVEKATGDLTYAISKLLVKEAHGDLVGKLVLNTATEQFVEVLSPCAVSTEFIDFKHDGTLGNGGIVVKFDAESKGTKTISIHYDCAHPAASYPVVLIYVYENGATEPKQFEMPSNGNGAWGRYQDFEITVNAVKGENEIRIASAVTPQGLNAHIDYLTIGALVPSSNPQTGDNGLSTLVYIIAIFSMAAKLLIVYKKRLDF